MGVCSNQSKEEKRTFWKLHMTFSMLHPLCVLSTLPGAQYVYEDSRLNYMYVCGVFFFVHFVFLDRVSENGILWKRTAVING